MTPIHGDAVVAGHPLPQAQGPGPARREVLAARFTQARLNPELSRADVLGLAALAGIGFTIALLFGELAFPDGANAQSVTAAVLVASLISASVAGAVLRRRNAAYRHLSDEEDASGNGNGNDNGNGDAGPGAAADRDGC